ncbi:fam-a protein [Plasmodium chabaudi adami]|uniref:Fam-a protein n=1 Tax=Plasmodium chabaudi adami TaxID=5826 RepID=A0A1C6WT17_PLACE|nr:fam-a protein [Plasmodium chabaudi adami]
MNKGYIKVVLALLCVARYMENVAFASEYAPTPSSSNEEYKRQLSSPPKKAKQKLSSAPKKINQRAHFIPIGFKQKEYFNPIGFKQKTCLNPIECKRQLSLKAKEAKHAEYIMAEALEIAKKHAIHTDDYKPYSKRNGEIVYFKKVNDTDIGKLVFTIPNPDNYGDIVNMLWDPNGEKKFNIVFAKGSISRIYNENLVIIQQIYNGTVWNVYYHAIAHKVELSEDETAILLVSSNMNDHNKFGDTNYINTIVESANSFTPDIDSDEDIRNGKLTKLYINLMVFFIKKEANVVKITHLCSIDHLGSPTIPQDNIRTMTAYKMLNFVELRDIFKK